MCVLLVHGILQHYQKLEYSTKPKRSQRNYTHYILIPCVCSQRNNAQLGPPSQAPAAHHGTHCVRFRFTKGEPPD